MALIEVENRGFLNREEIFSLKKLEIVKLSDTKCTNC